MLSRKEMVAIIQSGRSVFHNGRIITTEAELPNAAELAQGDPAAEANTAADLRAQMAEMQRQLDMLEARQEARGAQQASSGQPASTPLADDFPFAEQLRTAGYTTREQVAKASDKQLATVEGSDKETIKQIRGALET